MSPCYTYWPDGPDGTDDQACKGNSLNDAIMRSFEETLGTSVGFHVETHCNTWRLPLMAGWTPGENHLLFLSKAVKHGLFCISSK